MANSGHSLVLEKDSLCPISIIIHSGAKNDSKIFDEVLEELKRRRLIQKGQVILFDKGYYSMENYINAINKYNVVVVIFPKQSFTIENWMHECPPHWTSFMIKIH